MKIAVTYENGKVFQHFGKTETFQDYVFQALSSDFYLLLVLSICSIAIVLSVSRTVFNEELDSFRCRAEIIQ